MESGDQGPGLVQSARYDETADLRIPAQVDVAFDVVRWANSVENGGRCDSNSGGRELSVKERSVYEAGLEILRLYMTGEMNFDHSDSGGSEESSLCKQDEPCFFCKTKS